MNPSPLSTTNFVESLEQLKQQLAAEKQARKDTEERVRSMAAENKRLEIELIRYRDHFEALVASRTAELMGINAKLIQENRERRLAERERRSFEDQFREASLLLETVLNAIPDIIGVQDMNHRIIRFNKAGYEFFGKPQEEVIGKRCFELIGQQAPCDMCVMHQLFDTSETTQTIKYLDDRGLWMDVRAYPILDMDGRVVRIVEHWRDITTLKKSEASLKESEEKYRLLVENANAAIFIYQENKFRFTNRIAREMGRRIGMEDMRSPVDRFIHRDDRGEDPQRLLKRLNGGEKRPYAIVFRVMGKQDDEIWVELNTVNITWEGGPATLNFVRDITRNKKLEQRFQEAQRMESLGTLAGGIAHDFNNLLMGIQGNVSLMFLDMDQGHRHFDKIKSIEDCVESGSRLTKQLLGFARGGKYVVKPMDMNQIVRNSVDMFGRTRKAIKIHDQYGEDLWTVMVDRSQIEQVLVNLFLNAWQAMEGTGDLYLSTANVELDDKFVKPFEVAAGRYVRISVRDTGIGMTAVTQRRIFEPFFTTHEPGRGTGLGLASVFGIIKNHSGFITVESRFGHGSTFEFYLPATQKKPKEEKPPIESIQMGSECILLVDDEEYILDVGRLMLEGLGYTIVTANGGRDALKSFAEQGDTIKLVILDLVMPDMDGENVFHEMRKIRPDIKVLFASGHYVMEQTRELLRNGSSDFLQKPFNMRQLSTKIRLMMDK
jgi:two-component system, cell cycle sensor histidine kinase and response regulator CckA